MDPENDQDPSDQRENAVMAPLFMRKQPLNEAEKIEMDKEVESVREAMRAVQGMWEALAKLFSQKEKASIVCKDAYIDQAKEKLADYFNLAPSKTRSPAISKREKIIGLDEDTTLTHYRVWSRCIQETLKKQRQKTRYRVKKWFEYLHQFDGMDLQPEPARYTKPSFNFIYWVLVAMFWAAYVICGPEETNVCEGEPVACFQERMMQVFVRVYNFYLKFHNITIDYPEAIRNITTDYPEAIQNITIDYPEATGIAFDNK